MKEAFTSNIDFVVRLLVEMRGFYMKCYRFTAFYFLKEAFHKLRFTEVQENRAKLKRG